MSLQESMSVLLKPSIQKTCMLYLLFSFPFKLFVNKTLWYRGDWTFWALKGHSVQDTISFSFIERIFFFFQFTMKTEKELSKQV